MQSVYIRAAIVYLVSFDIIIGKTSELLLMHGREKYKDQYMTYC